MLYAAIGLGYLAPVRPGRVEAIAGGIARQVVDGRLGPRMLAAHCWGVRDWLGLPTGPWTGRDDQAAERGRNLCANLPPEPASRSIW